VIKTVFVCLALLTLGGAVRAAATGYYPDSSYSQSWTPDGTALIYRAQFPVGIRRVTLDGKISTLLLGNRDLNAHVSLHGKLAYISQAAEVSAPAGSLIVRDASGQSRVVAQAREHGGFSWSPDGGAIAFQIARGGLATVSADGSSRREFPYIGNDPAWSPDGTRIAFSRASETVVVDVATGVAHAVGPTFLYADGFHLARAYPGALWSPDSTRLAIDLNDGVHVVRSDGSGTDALIRDAHLPSWSPDGSELAVSRDDNIVAVTANGSSERVIVASAMSETAPTWSPDGRWVAYTNVNVTPPQQAFQEGHAADVFIVRPDGSGRRSLTGGCDVGPGTPLAWVCVVNGRFAVPLRDARSRQIRITPETFQRAVRIRVFVTDGSRYVYGARVTVRQLSGPRVHLTSVSRTAPSLVTDTGGRAAFRFLKPKTHGLLTFRVLAAGRVRLLKLRV
jgi:Tol biopolymer transport system component